MGLNGFVFGFAAVVLMGSTTVVGGAFVVGIWLDMFRERFSRREWRIPTSLYPFTISVAVHPIALTCLGLVSDAHRPAMLTASIMLATVALSFALLLLTMIRLHRKSGPGTRAIAVGSKVLLVITVVGLIGIALGLPGEIETWHG
jgi:hypothetical protein